MKLSKNKEDTPANLAERGVPGVIKIETAHTGYTYLYTRLM
ncbi:MAG: hypothetical protein Q8930_18965 [Bacillota bacterium]|nr:hypothetical protein [Bacillota bacterium]